MPIVLSDPQPGTFVYNVSKPPDPQDPVTPEDAGYAIAFENALLHRYQKGNGVNLRSLYHAGKYKKQLFEATDPAPQDHGVVLQQIHNTLQNVQLDITTLKEDVHTLMGDVRTLKVDLAAMQRQTIQYINIQTDGILGPLDQVPFLDNTMPWGANREVNVLAGDPQRPVITVRRNFRDIEPLEVVLPDLKRVNDINDLTLHQLVAYFQGYHHYDENNGLLTEQHMKQGLCKAIGCRVIYS
ncbi:hypothetical protein E1B28_004290 [Marasmius oreades]|uniref:Mug135-like C-terminal domain-containing protein n=1 Tax=Marasmius oreades TaxID=181124 RepID=A0A9P8ACU6_9AGAR|nr:uncharacterized protein E1B28_004290 [Marasmius oreades]KAG7096884.1 hypothetical protein E1B28_004290 [Marasmius oreades]